MKVGKWVKDIHRTLAEGWWFLAPQRTMPREEHAKERHKIRDVQQQFTKSLC